MSTNLATIITGPCLISFKGSTFRSKGDVKLDLSLETFDIVNDLYQAVDKRVSGQPMKISFTPEGRFADLNVLYPYPSVNLGSLVTPLHLVTAVDATADTIAVAETSLAVATPVSFGSDGAVPTGLTAATTYYLGVNASRLRKLYTTAANAIAATSAIDLTDVGSGTLRFVEQWPLVILGIEGTQVTLFNAAVTKMPPLNLKSIDTLFGEVEISGYPKNGQPWSNANSIYSIDSAAFADSGFSPADIITQPYTGSWGSTLTSFSTKQGFVIDFALGLDPVQDDASGIMTHRITSLGVTAKAQPMGISLATLMTALNLQGTGATRGRSLAGSNLNITGTGAYIRLYAAALTGGPAQWGTKLERVGELTWAATRTFTSGVANPLFFIGAAAPS